MNANDTVVVNGKSYTILEVLGVGPAVREQLGITGQYAVQGGKGGLRLYQTFANGSARLITRTHRVEYAR
jgi:hypothetical protein